MVSTAEAVELATNEVAIPAAPAVVGIFACLSLPFGVVVFLVVVARCESASV